MIGINTPRVVRVEPRRGPTTSLVPVRAASNLLNPSSNFLATLSATTMALSTNSPIARANAEMVKIFRVRSAAYIVAKLAAIETGMEVATTKEILHPPIKISITKITTISAITED